MKPTLYHKIMLSSFTFTLLIILNSCTEKVKSATTDMPIEKTAFSFKNPILAHGADPWVIKKDSIFYYCYSANNTLWVQTTHKLHDLKNATTIAQWTPEEGQSYSKELWAPELHFINHYWYIYFAADNGNNDNHRMYVLKSKNENDLSGGFEFAGQLKTSSDKWAIDGTVAEIKNQLYFIWSGWEGDQNVSQNLYIAKMKSPTEIASDRVLISKPEYAWEKLGSENGLPTINEGPEVLQHANETFIIYSASGSWSNYYQLGELHLTGNDPLNPEDWKKKENPVFTGANEVYSPGHASFVTIQKESWIVYHTARHKDAGWDREVRIQPFTWRNNEPEFGKPIPTDSTITITY
ncbi:family 43 glycosylhydrolase [Zhouia sp. PK063]|uniref:glycoside hydrolase family 43 protein n=1 Tax=Zhouia sp. PK063 TaxID=3373602 RepID=UPI00378CEA28